MGDWYSFIVTKDFALECGLIEYTMNEDKSISLDNSGQYYDGTSLGDRAHIQGTADYDEAGENVGHLLINLDGVPVVGDYNIVATDYDSYAIIYNCSQQGLLTKKESAWLLTREPFSGKTDANKEIIKAAKDKLYSYGFWFDWNMRYQI